MQAVLQENRYWVFVHDIGLSTGLGDFLAGAKSLEGVHNTYFNCQSLHSRQIFAVFDSYSGRQFVWPVMNDDGQLLLSESELCQYFDQNEDAELFETIEFYCSGNKGKQDRLLALPKALRKRYYLLIHPAGWASSGMLDLYETSASATNLKRKARVFLSDNHDHVAFMFDTDSSEPGFHAIEIASV